MKYNYIIENYHPRDVSFEVSAILMDEARLENKAKPNDFEAHSNYAHDSYARDIELSFNTVTNKQPTVKYTNQKHNKAAMHYYIEKLKKEKLRSLAQKSIANIAITATRKSLSAILQSMLTKFNLANNKITQEKEAPNSFLHLEEINHILYATNHQHKIEEEQTKEKIKVKVQYTLHPHVDALLLERSHTHSLEISI